jgi:hypothetical protein
MPTQLSRVKSRLWRPHLGLFWLVVAFNLLSSAMAWAIHLGDPQGALRWMLAVFALSNAVVGWWLTWRLWCWPEDEVGTAATPARKTL